MKILTHLSAFQQDLCRTSVQMLFPSSPDGLFSDPLHPFLLSYHNTRVNSNSQGSDPTTIDVFNISRVLAGELLWTQCFKTLLIWNQYHEPYDNPNHLNNSENPFHYMSNNPDVSPSARHTRGRLESELDVMLTGHLTSLLHQFQHPSFQPYFYKIRYYSALASPASSSSSSSSSPIPQLRNDREERKRVLAVCLPLSLRQKWHSVWRALNTGICILRVTRVTRVIRPRLDNRIILLVLKW